MNRKFLAEKTPNWCTERAAVGAAGRPDSHHSQFPSHWETQEGGISSPCLQQGERWIRGAWPGWLGDDTGPRRLSGQAAGGGSSCAENRTAPRGSDRSAQPRRRRWTPQSGLGLGRCARTRQPRHHPCTRRSRTPDPAASRTRGTIASPAGAGASRP